MKKIISFVLALTLLVGLFAVSAVAFADDAERTVTIDNVALKAKVLEAFPEFADAHVADGSRNLLDLIKDQQEAKIEKDKVGDIFVGINYKRTWDTDYNGTSSEAKYDTITIEYYTPSKDRKEDGDTSTAGSVSFGTVGMWSFRYVVKSYYDSTEKTGGDVLAKSELFHVNIVDVNAPKVTVQTTKKNSAESDGLTAGTSFSVKSYSYYFTATDTSSISYTYVIKKLIGGDWKEIYNSVDKTVADDYKDFVTAGGTITPTADDVSDEPVYKIIYTIKDSNGYVANLSEDDATLSLKVLAAKTTDTTTDGVSAWKIILYVIAGLSAVGIVVLLFVKPKQAQPAGGKIHYGADAEATDASADADVNADSDNQ